MRSPSWRRGGAPPTRPRRRCARRTSSTCGATRRRPALVPARALTAGASCSATTAPRLCSTCTPRPALVSTSAGHLEGRRPHPARCRRARGRRGVRLDGLVLDPEPLHLSSHVVDFCGGHGRVTTSTCATWPGTRAARPEVSEESLDVRWWPVDALPPRSRHGGDGGRRRAPGLRRPAGRSALRVGPHVAVGGRRPTRRRARPPRGSPSHARPGRSGHPAPERGEWLGSRRWASSWSRT